jgi:small subunit ribosomal protein S17
VAEEEQNEETPVAEPVAEEAPAEESPAGEPAEAAEEPAAEEPAAEAAPAPPAPEPKKKRKRLPRSQRPRKTRPTRARATERKKITRLPKPERERGRNQERRGVVVSDAMDKTIVVRVESIKSHPRYKKVVRRSTKFHAHDERNEAGVGDVVRIVETRPLSKTKNWRLAEIVEKAR